MTSKLEEPSGRSSWLRGAGVSMHSHEMKRDRFYPLPSTPKFCSYVRKLLESRKISCSRTVRLAICNCVKRRYFGGCRSPLRHAGLAVSAIHRKESIPGHANRPLHT
ncbi:hypothetical protein E2C01_092741 [Portunus trituberculatus]|uniref:Uncharacterized protein n=1 Tax=Portunus trituberculatus TaxID=210409 RepID=A0A5B7JSZ8_PORTR|nr:hypothetical protein [Portunus trituberculatus]